jgi:hypothetical protein
MKAYCNVFALMLLFFSGILLSSDRVCAQISVEVEVYPNIQGPLTIGSDMVTEILLKARVKPDSPLLKFEWELSGAGRFEGDKADPKILYIPPDKIEGAEEQAVVQLRVGGPGNLSGEANVSFTLQNPEGTAAKTTETAAPPSSDTETDTSPTHPSGESSSDVSPSVPEIPENSEKPPSVEASIHESAPEQIFVKLETDSDIRTIFPGLDAKKIMITARTNKEQPVFKWTVEGPGRLDSSDNPSQMFYIPPDTLADEKDTPVTVTVSLSDDSEPLTDTLTFTLRYIPPPPQTGEIQVSVSTENVSVFVNEEYKGAAHPNQDLICRGIPTGEITVNASAGDYSESKTVRVEADQTVQVRFDARSQLSVESLLEKGNAYFEKRFFTSPKGTNAFEVYQQVLALNPDTPQAREKIHKMGQFYKAWGDGAYQKKECSKARRFYERYLRVSEYEMNTLGIRENESEIQDIRKLLKNFGCAEAPAPSKQTPSTDELIKDSMNPLLEGL